jgi:hypothetical protein
MQQSVYVVRYRWRGWSDGCWAVVGHGYATREEAVERMQRMSRRQQIAFQWKVEALPASQSTAEPMEKAA